MFFKREKFINLMPLKKLQPLYREVFSGVKGNIVLTDILIDLCMWDEIEDEEKIDKLEKMYLNNAAKKILRKCGILHEENAELLTRALMKMPIKQKSN